MSTLVANPEDRFSRDVAHIFVDAGFVFTKIYLSKMRDPFGMALLRMAYEPQHDKTNKVTVHPAKTQMSLGIRPVWSESSLCAEWVAKDPRFLHADSEDSDQTGRMPRLIWVFAGRVVILLALSCRGSYVLLWLSFSRFLQKNTQTAQVKMLVCNILSSSINIFIEIWNVISDLKRPTQPIWQKDHAPLGR